MVHNFLILLNILFFIFLYILSFSKNINCNDVDENELSNIIIPKLRLFPDNRTLIFGNQKKCIKFKTIHYVCILYDKIKFIKDNENLDFYSTSNFSAYNISYNSSLYYELMYNKKNMVFYHL